MLNPGLGWIYEISQPRYLTNYYGLRNRLAILNENYVYADFRSRVNGCYSLMRTLIEYAVANKPEIKDLLNSADRKTVMRGLDPGPEDSLGIVFDVRSAGDVTIRTYEAELVQGENGWNSYRTVSYTHLRAHETVLDLVCRLLLEKKKQYKIHSICPQPIKPTN